MVVVRGQPLPGEWTAHGAISLWATGTSMFGLGETSGYWPPDTELAAILLKKPFFRRHGPRRFPWFVRKNGLHKSFSCIDFWGAKLSESGQFSNISPLNWGKIPNQMGQPTTYLPTCPPISALPALINWLFKYTCTHACYHTHNSIRNHTHWRFFTCSNSHITLIIYASIHPSMYSPIHGLYLAIAMNMYPYKMHPSSV